ncbi:MAG: EAL domain-containing protein [Acidimicrobiales bacterium]
MKDEAGDPAAEERRIEYQLLAALQEREHDLAEAQRLAHLGSWSWDMTTNVITWSDELYRIFDVADRANAPSFEAFLALVHPEDRSRVERTVRDSAISFPRFSFDHRLASDPQRWMRCRGVVDVDSEGAPVRMHGTGQEVTEALAAQRSLAELRRRVALLTEASTVNINDPLTGLANHAVLIDYARRALVRAARHHWITAVLVIDIDGFSDINEALGHEGGDEVLVQVAARLLDAFRASDAVGRASSVSDSVARFGGDRFVVVCENVEGPDVSGALGARVSAVLDNPIALSGGGTTTVTAGVGVAITGSTEPSVHALIREAEAAVVRAKLRGRGQCEVMTDGVAGAPGKRMEAERSLRRALERDQFCLYYQAKLSLESDRITGAEALLRWQDPERGLVLPLQFIPLAEATGLIVPLGKWVIEEACRQVADWSRRFPHRLPLVVAVNVSGRQLGSGLIDTVAGALAASGAAPDQLCLEVTESILMEDADAAAAILADLAALGVKLSIDDFGTGYSSLAYLKRFPLHELKIDKSFVDGLGDESHDTAIVAATVAMAHALGLSVIAEGVETPDQLERLRVIGCQEVQGYLISRPQPAPAMALLLAEGAEPKGSLVGRDEHRLADDPYRAKRILVVDDAPDVRQLARMTLAAVGFEVQEAANGADAMAVAGRMYPDCVLLDAMMPDMTGSEVCRALRVDPATAGATIVMLTANVSAEDKIEAFSAGADDYIIKPFSPRDLVARVRAAMRRRMDVAESPGFP